MKFPNKVVSYNESIISKFPIVLSVLIEKDYSVEELYFKLKTNFNNINDFLDVLDCLFALEKININRNTRSLYYVK